VAGGTDVDVDVVAAVGGAASDVDAPGTVVVVVDVVAVATVAGAARGGLASVAAAHPARHSAAIVSRGYRERTGRKSVRRQRCDGGWSAAHRLARA
jgi:hypothetical protein